MIVYYGSLDYLMICSPDFLVARSCWKGFKLLWEEVRKAYPDQWVVIEALQAYSDNQHRIVNEIAVIDTFDDSMDALRRHAELHKQKPDRKLYFFHTSREHLDIQEKTWAGIRKI